MFTWYTIVWWYDVFTTYIGNFPLIQICLYRTIIVIIVARPIMCIHISLLFWLFPMILFMCVCSMIVIVIRIFINIITLIEHTPQYCNSGYYLMNIIWIFGEVPSSKTQMRSLPTMVPLELEVPWPLPILPAVDHGRPRTVSKYVGVTSKVQLQFHVLPWNKMISHGITMRVGGLEHFLFFHILGRIIPTD